MRVLLLQPQFFSPGLSLAVDDPRSVSVGLLYIAAELDRAGHDVSVGLATQGNIHRLVERTAPGIVGFSVVTPGYPFTQTLISTVKADNPRIPIVLGGYHPTFRTEDVLTETAADYIIRGEGERAMLQLVSALEGPAKLSSVPNLSYWNGKEIVHNRTGPPLDIDRLPFPAREKVDIPIPAINESRGCPYACTFCSIRSFYGGAWRPRNIEQFIAELRYMRDTLGYRHISVQSDNFLVDPKRVEAICRAIIDHGLDDVSYQSPGRIDVMAKHPRLLDLMVDAGWTHVNFGLESGVQAIIDESYHKRISLAQARSVAQRLHDANIHVGWTFIIGSGDDYDTEENIQKSIEFLLSTPYDAVGLTILTPFPGTPLFHQLQRENRILTYDWRRYDAMHCVYRPKYLSPQKLEELYAKALWQIYANGGPIGIMKRAHKAYTAKYLTGRDLLNLFQLAVNVYRRRKNIYDVLEHSAEQFTTKIERLCQP